MTSEKPHEPPALVLTADDCVDILTTIARSAPVDPGSWWADEGRASHVCGFTAVLEAIANSITEIKRPRKCRYGMC